MLVEIGLNQGWKEERNVKHTMIPLYGIETAHKMWRLDWQRLEPGLSA